MAFVSVESEIRMIDLEKYLNGGNGWRALTELTFAG